jgi:starch synthase
MTQSLRILLVSSEVEPFAKTGGLADVAGALPRALRALGHDVRVLMPRYSGIDRHAGSLRPAVPRVRVPLGDRIAEGALFEGRMADAIPIYFLAHDQYYDRPALYGEGGADYPDNCERFVFFARGSLEALRALGWIPRVVHANDWQTGLVPVYLETLYKEDPALRSVGTLFTVHNLAYQGTFWHLDMPITGLGWDLFTPAGLEFYGKINFLKGGLVFADLLNTVSTTYAEEIQTPEFGCGLEGVLRFRSADLHGVVNGIDEAAWNPATDGDIAKPFSPDDLAGKAACRSALAEELRLDADGVPLVGIVSRLVAQKGLDLVLDALPALIEAGFQLALLGSGEPALEQAFARAAATHRGRLAIHTGFDAGLARRIYAGADVFLMPSRYEPCGLGQMIAMRYGTVPIVRWTGGLKDTVTEVRPGRRTGTGFGFAEATPEALMEAARRALAAYREPGLWRQIIRNAMGQDFSWQASAKDYVALYRKAARAAARGRA